MTLQNIIYLFGGLGLFLFGMKIMGDGLENYAGNRLKNILEKITSNKIMGILVGALVTGIIQSSSATTVMVVGFVNASLMNLYQATSVIMGANIGTTVTGLLVSFKIMEYTPLAIACGAAIVLFASKNKTKDLGNILLGFGILFLGMQLMGDSMKPLAESDAFKNLVVYIGNNWFLGILIGAAFTGIIQSSSATTGILITLANTGVVDINVIVPILFGCNIGTCVTALLSSINTTKTAKKAAIIHLLFNSIGTIMFIPLIGILITLVGKLAPGDFGRQVAYSHIIFNLSNTLLLYPFIGALVTLSNKIIRGEDSEELMSLKYIDKRFLEAAQIGMTQASKEILRMAYNVREGLHCSINSFLKKDDEMVKKVYEFEKLTNLLDKEITDYLVQVSSRTINDDDHERITNMFHIINDLERIGDHSENIADLCIEACGKDLKFTNQAIVQIKQMFDECLKVLNYAIDCFQHFDEKKFTNVLSTEDYIDRLEREFRESNINRLNRGECNADESTIFLDMISNIERISDHSTNIAEHALKS